MSGLLLRCSKCGSDAGFLLETKDNAVLPIKGKILLDRIKKPVGVKCSYCNNKWDHVPFEQSAARPRGISDEAFHDEMEKRRREYEKQSRGY